MLGKIMFIKPGLKKGRLYARVTVQTEEQGYRQALLPERELAALVPRSLLVYHREEAPYSLLGIISSLLKRTAMGRRVRLHESAALGPVVTFLPWSEVRFRKPDPDPRTSGEGLGQGGKPPLHEDAEGHGHVQGTLGAGQPDGNATQALIG